MDFASALSETKREVGKDDDFWVKPGNYLALFGLVFFFVSIAQVLAMVWDAQKVKAKTNRKAPSFDEDHQAAETERIYKAIEKLAKVNIGHNNNNV